MSASIGLGSTLAPVVWDEGKDSNASLGLKTSSGKKINPCLSLNSQQILFAPNGVKFLGLHIDAPLDKSKSRSELLSRFTSMLVKVDACPLMNKQKLLMYRSGVAHASTGSLL